MKRRCHDPNGIAWRYYGGRGIRVYGPWLDDYPAFLAYVGEPPEGCTLDRIDSNGHYEPGNVRWATRSQQARNYQKTRYITIGGETMPVVEACERFGFNIRSVYVISHREGLTHDVVLQQFLDGTRRSKRKEMTDGCR